MRFWSKSMERQTAHAGNRRRPAQRSQRVDHACNSRRAVGHCGRRHDARTALNEGSGAVDVTREDDATRADWSSCAETAHELHTLDAEKMTNASKPLEKLAHA